MRQLKIVKQVTNRETLSIEKYLQEIGKVALLTLEEEVELARQIKTGDRNALEKLTKANLRFVVSVSKQYQNQGLTLGDLINEGNVGLIKAAQRFDETRGFKFISYAVWWIRQAILQALAEQARLVRLPLNKIGSINKINRAYSKLEQEFEREPSANEISDILDMDADDIRDTMRSSGRHVSMDAPIMMDEETTMIEFLQNDNDGVTPDTELMNESLKQEINRALSTLSKKESEILADFYGLNTTNQMTMDEIANKFHLTRERVRQIKEKALKRLKHTSRGAILRTYLG
jgi:RNA polymerase primary sigma factor